MATTHFRFLILTSLVKFVSPRGSPGYVCSQHYSKKTGDEHPVLSHGTNIIYDYYQFCFYLEMDKFKNLGKQHQSYGNINKNFCYFFGINKVPFILLNLWVVVRFVTCKQGKVIQKSYGKKVVQIDYRIEGRGKRFSFFVLLNSFPVSLSVLQVFKKHGKKSQIKFTLFV